MPLVTLLPEQAVLLGHREESPTEFPKQTSDIVEPDALWVFPVDRFKSNLPDLVYQGFLAIPTLLGVNVSKEILSSNGIAVSCVLVGQDGKHGNIGA